MKISRLYHREAVTAELDDTVAKAAKRMRLHGVSALPVVQHGRVLGIITERDVTNAVALDLDPRLTPVDEVMTQHPLVASPDDDARMVAMQMLEHGIRHLPVVDDHRLLGMMSARDLLVLEIWQPTLGPYSS